MTKLSKLSIMFDSYTVIVMQREIQWTWQKVLYFPTFKCIDTGLVLSQCNSTYRVYLKCFNKLRGMIVLIKTNKKWSGDMGSQMMFNRWKSRKFVRRWTDWNEKEILQKLLLHRIDKTQVVKSRENKNFTINGQSVSCGHYYTK